MPPESTLTLPAPHSSFRALYLVSQSLIIGLNHGFSPTLVTGMGALGREGSAGSRLKGCEFAWPWLLPVES